MIKNCLWNFLVNQVTISAAHYTNAKTLKPSGASGHFAAPSKTDKRQSPCPYFENSAAAKTSSPTPFCPITESVSWTSSWSFLIVAFYLYATWL